MKRIGFVSVMESYAWGGSEELWSRAALRLVGKGYTVGANVKGWPETPEPLQKLEKAGCQITRRAGDSSLVSKIIRRVRKPPTAWLETFKPDFVVISDGMNFGGDHWMRECAAKNIPFVTIAQAANENFWPWDALALELRPAFAKARGNFFVSRGNLELSKKQFAYPFENAQVIFNPFSVPFDAAPLYPETHGAWKMACVGRIAMEPKGQDLLVDVLRQDKWRERPLEVSLWGHGPHCELMAEMIKMRGLKNIQLCGVTPNVVGIWEQNQILIMPSRYEGLPLALVEAMLCGRPAIVTDVAGNAELLEDNVTGFIATAPHPTCLDEAMERAWARREDWQAMGQMAAKSVRAQVPADPIEHFIEKLLPLME